MKRVQVSLTLALLFSALFLLVFVAMTGWAGSSLAESPGLAPLESVLKL